MAVTQPSLRVVKQFPYRGNPLQRFTNRYYFDGSDPGPEANWYALFDAWTLEEQRFQPGDTHIIEAHGFLPGSDVAVASKTYNLAGTLPAASAISTPGDCAAVLRMATTKKSVKNHPVYVFSYYHNAIYQGGTSDRDTLHPTMKSAMENFGDVLLNGLIVGARTYRRTTPDGHSVTGHHVEQYIGHRDFVN